MISRGRLYFSYTSGQGQYCSFQNHEKGPISPFKNKMSNITTQNRKSNKGPISTLKNKMSNITTQNRKSEEFLLFGSSIERVKRVNMSSIKKETQDSCFTRKDPGIAHFFGPERNGNYDAFFVTNLTLFGIIK